MAEIADDTTTKATLDTRDAEAGTFSGLLENIGDHDFVRVSLDAGVAYQFYLSLLETGSLTDGDAFLAIRDSQGNIVTTIDNGGVGTNAFLLFVAPSSGTYFLDISAAGDNVTGQYSLVSAVAAGSTNFFKTDGDDIVSTVSPGERTIGGKGADAIILATDGLDALGEQGNDTLTGNNSINELFGGLGNDIINGLGGGDIIFGEAGDDQIFGGDAHDLLRGGTGSDTLFGEAGRDVLFGGADKDFLTGGTGRDIFSFAALSDSKRGAERDVITDFSHGDVIDLFGIGKNKFEWIGNQAFHEERGELHFVKKGGYLLVEGDTDGNGKADFQIKVIGLHNIVADDFIL